MATAPPLVHIITRQISSTTTISLPFLFLTYTPPKHSKIYGDTD